MEVLNDAVERLLTEYELLLNRYDTAIDSDAGFEELKNILKEIKEIRCRLSTISSTITLPTTQLIKNSFQ